MNQVRRDRSAAAPLALAWAALVVYASLFPFSEWRWPPGATLPGVLLLPWPRWRDSFDTVANLVGYLPLGLLGLVALRRQGSAWGTAVLVAWGLPTLGSYAMEVTQVMLPRRVPSLLDLLLNSAGALLGMLLGAWLLRTELPDRLTALRRRWIAQQGAGALLLLLLWPFGLLFPTPVPLGLGQVWEPLRPALAEGLAGVPWAAPTAVWLDEALVIEPLGAPAEALAIAFGLLGPCLLAFSLVQGVWRRLLLAGGALVLGFGISTLSSALGFGPDHALAWLTPPTLPGLAVGLLLALACLRADMRLAAGLGLVVLTGLVALVTLSPTDPYFADSLQSWEQGRFIRFNGAAQWVGWLWPYVAIGWLLRRIATND